MTDTITPLVLDLLEWIAVEPRPYSQVMDAWRTSCPRLMVWEEANERGFLAQDSVAGRETLVRLTALGHSFLDVNGRVPADQEAATANCHRGRIEAV
jgi:hypothetical protein